MAKAAGPSQPAVAPAQPHVFKLVLLGSGSVGKSSLALRYVRDKFRDPLPTVGCKCQGKTGAAGVYQQLPEPSLTGMNGVGGGVHCGALGSGLSSKRAQCVRIMPRW